ncbi:iron ABC transporter permease [uncultured Campylobacter sp.]|uniref:FecCD family ABC transporter permease n=1 Tax=uncultured Campylobacter sp. TaxID=218934 RepID=UPI002639818C|nr:iron ABC transporter permease [uncultured Campylobacter sp.]
MFRTRLFMFSVFTVLAYFVMFFLAICIGDEVINPMEIFSNDLYYQIIIDIRLPRVLMAILVGMLLASSGTITQTVFSNPIADPYIIGIASTAAFGATLAYMLGMSDFYYGILGFLCSCAFSLLIFRIASNASLSTLLVIGISVATFLGSISSFLSYIIGEQSFKITAFLMGYLGIVSYLRVALLAFALCLCLGIFYFHRNELNIILSTDDEALSMGVNSKKLKKILLVVSSIAVSFGVAFTGLIAFVGLIIPHMVRVIIRDYDNTKILPLCTLFGGLFLLVCDTFARFALAPVEIPIGIITSLIGAPIFLYLALKIRRID